MLNGLLEHGRRAGVAAQARAIARGAARLRDELGEELPEIAVTAGDDGIVLSARGLRRRLESDARLRWIGSLWR